MKRKSIILVMYDSPNDPEFIAWMNGPHYDEVRATPGVVAARRYEVVDGPSDRRQYAAIIETEDLDATIAWRDSPEGQRSQKEANDRGVHNRYSLICRLANSTVPKEMQ